MTAPRTLVVDVGNTTVFAGVFSGTRLLRRFRLTAKEARQAATWSRLAAGPLQRIALCSVVPRLTPAIVRTLNQAFAVTPRVLTASASHGLKIGYRRPAELGTDRIACALGAQKLYPGRHAIVVDCGTATTVTALHRDGTLLGGAILPGLGLWPTALAKRTAQLPAVAPVRPRRTVGRSTEEALHSGIFHGHAGAIRELIGLIRTEAFGRTSPVVVGTGGHAPRFYREHLFNSRHPDLILTGLSVFASRLSHDA